ncbi:hypothetical protein Pint_09642 [Pistacia integerrima]|uniref:Uncharacterized protein n=1 Tax=Pistacia integerrima TaxID=434235 RepID=A0ACC0XHY4_9ROSI|nr:hypothetical protein Pint_09642 [Pistacia integerrima]
MRINQTASQPQIKAAYRTLAKIYHPDIATSSQANIHNFIQIHTAYSILSDPIARARYDLSFAACRCQFTSNRPKKRRGTDQCW